MLNVFSGSSVWHIITNILDIVIIAYVIYRLLLLIRGTRAVQLIKGLIVLVAAAFLSEWLGLSTISWILKQAWALIFIAMAVIFQPELRKALEQIGRGRFFSRSGFNLNSGQDSVINQVVGAAVAGAKTRTGMLMVIERNTGLNDYIENGIITDALVTEEFLVNIFVPNTPMHDGAAIIRGNRVMAVACFLPLTDNPYISSSLGTRHRAAIGLSEVSDALIIVVSEETGQISLARDSKLVRSLDEKTLRGLLAEAIGGDNREDAKNSRSYFWQRRTEK